MAAAVGDHVAVNISVNVHGVDATENQSPSRRRATQATQVDPSDRERGISVDSTMPEPARSPARPADLHVNGREAELIMQIRSLKNKIRDLENERQAEKAAFCSAHLWQAASGARRKFHLTPDCGGFAGNPSAPLEMCLTCSRNYMKGRVSFSSSDSCRSPTPTTRPDPRSTRAYPPESQ